MPYGLKPPGLGGGGGKSNFFSRGTSLATKYQSGNTSDSSDDVDDKDEWKKEPASGKGASRRGSQVITGRIFAF